MKISSLNQNPKLNIISSLLAGVYYESFICKTRKI
nr:MAG TPA: hypothetical protein [Caudoviricetes sp.]